MTNEKLLMRKTQGSTWAARHELADSCEWSALFHRNRQPQIFRLRPAEAGIRSFENRGWVLPPLRGYSSLSNRVPRTASAAADLSWANFFAPSGSGRVDAIGFSSPWLDPNVHENAEWLRTLFVEQSASAVNPKFVEEQPQILRPGLAGKPAKL